jgi:hypothetical protein
MNEPEFYCDEMDDEECFMCGGSGLLDECECGEDTCCCRYLIVMECPECNARLSYVREG